MQLEGKSRVNGKSTQLKKLVNEHDWQKQKIKFRELKGGKNHRCLRAPPLLKYKKKNKTV